MTGEPGGARTPARSPSRPGPARLTSGPAGHVRDGAVAVPGHRIEAVGPYERLPPGLPEAEVAGDGTHSTPGFEQYELNQ